MKKVAESRRSPRRIKVLVDVNILLDVILDREPWADDATRLLDAIALDTIEGFVAGTSIATVHYLIARAADRPRAATAISDLLEIFEVVPLANGDFQRALGLGLDDNEDAIQVAAALKVGADAVVTRNARDFKPAPVNILTAGETLALVASVR